MDMNELLTNEFFIQAKSLATLYAEILICIAAASLLGWIVGFMMQRSRYRKKLKETRSSWKTRVRDLEKASRSAEDSLEKQIQSMATEHKSLKSANRALTDTLKKSDANRQKARAESIELNRQHTESHERLQRIIQQKDREILELGNRLSIDKGRRVARENQHLHSTTHIAPAKPSHLTPLPASHLSHADTVLTQQMTNNQEILDATVQISIPATISARQSESLQPVGDDDSVLLDETSDIHALAAEEATLALDADAVAQVQRAYKERKADD